MDIKEALKLKAEAREREEREIERAALALSESEFEQFIAERDAFVPSLFDVDEMLDKRIVGEKYNRLSVFTVFILSQICVYVSGDSGAGKTQLMEAVASTLMPDTVCVVSQGSDKAIFNSKKARDINKSSYVIMPELNKIASNVGLVEVLKTWGEGKSAKYEQSEFGKTLNTVPLDCKPFMFSRATESATLVPIPGELMTRVAEFMVDSSKNQTKDVMDSIADAAERPFTDIKIDRLKEAQIRYYVTNLKKDFHYVNPMAKVLTEYVPAIFAASRRDFKRYLRNINGICNFHYKDRMQIDSPDGRGALIVTPADVFYNHIIFGQTLIRSAMRCNQIERKIIKICEEKAGCTKAEIQRALREASVNTTLANIENHLKDLTNIGYLMAERDGREYYYYVTDFYNEFNVKPNFKDLIAYTIKSVNEHDYLTISQKSEYISKYCEGEGLVVNHPFTGKLVNITNFEFEDINNEIVKVDMLPNRGLQATLV